MFGLRLLRPLCLLVMATVVRAYDVGCLYPPDMPLPFDAHSIIQRTLGEFGKKNGVETPLVVRNSVISAHCGLNCLAWHDDMVLDAVTRQRPPISIPPEYHNSFSRMICFAQCVGGLVEAQGLPFLTPLWTAWNLPIQSPRTDVELAFAAGSINNNWSMLEALLQAEDYNPFVIGQVQSASIGLYFLQDGWNQQGTLRYDEETGEIVPCTANCLPYTDTSGYTPRNLPDRRRRGRRGRFRGSKYVVRGDDMLWAPLEEAIGLGNIVEQQHVTPHIGLYGRPMLHTSLDEVPELSPPGYRYRQEALLVVERVRVTASDPIKKQKIEFYDDKGAVRRALRDSLRQQFPTSHSFEEFLLFAIGIGASEYESVLLAWREKVRHDLVRPTTVIQGWGSDVLDTFGGNKTLSQSVQIAARDFQAFQRVMPHSEYPSGSSCICTSFAEYADAFTQEYNGGETLKDVTFEDEDGTVLLTIEDMDELRSDCGQSRLWGGLHFTAAVTAGEELCTGVGLKGMDLQRTLRNGSSLGSQYFRGDPRPVCGAA